MLNIEIITDFEGMLLGKRHSIPSEYFGDSAWANEQRALDIFRYVIEKHLKWTPSQASVYFNARVVQFFNLKNLLRFINFPDEIDEQLYYYYIVHKLYPKQVPFNLVEITQRIYRQMFNGERNKYPKRFFDGRRGEVRAIACLRYAIINYCPASNIMDLYKFFASNEAMQFINKYKLKQPYLYHFDYPIDYLHATFDEGTQQQNNMLYLMYRFMAYEEKQKRIGDKALSKSNK